MPRTYLTAADYDRIHTAVALIHGDGLTIAEAAAKLRIAPERCATLMGGPVARAIIRYVYDDKPSRVSQLGADAFTLSRAGLRDAQIARLINQPIASVERWTAPRNLRARVRRVDVAEVNRQIERMRRAKIAFRANGATTPEGYMAKQYQIPWRAFARVIGYEYMNKYLKAEAEVAMVTARQRVRDARVIHNHQ